MFPPFGFNGTLTISLGPVLLDQVAERLVIALADEGANDIARSHETITFRGIDRMRFSPLQNIASGKIKLHFRSTTTDLLYAIRMDLHGLIVSAGVALVALALMAFGMNANGFALFSAAVLGMVVSYSIIIRFWFARWLHKAAAKIQTV